ncbi:aminopeptidase N-like isoform X1 [Sardina pilchardus]|uniref:aminopeptidase N-like isoform X1 n=2 Tax=Sardina pilchardus TaxID=27697 RepID=UPI002E0F4E92
MVLCCNGKRVWIMLATMALVCVSVIAGLWVYQLTGFPEPTNTWDHYRLPTTLVPERYDVTLWPRLDPDANGVHVFTGHSTVRFRSLRDTNLILLHCKQLELSKLDKEDHHVRLTALSGTAPAIRKTWLHEPWQYLVVQLNGVVKAGQDYELYTEFSGVLSDDLEGLYRSEYKEDGVTKVVATSQMHPTHARKTFPCFDEPAMKAVFHITVLHKPGTVALSNGMDIATESTTVEGQAVTKTTFEPTEKMSTYLLALVVCDFDDLASTAGNTSVRIWARKNAITQGHGSYALNVTVPVLNFFEEYYNIPYPLSKSDQIALPDFYFGAMENWGLVTYREANLLYDPDVSSNRNKETTATIIAHELAHMWFGNLVTLKWWNEVWLNEGFASYVSYLGADRAEPTWNVKDLIVLDDVHRVFAVDALASSHPLSSKEEEIQRPEQISELFDAISYSKGASVLRMLSDFLTEPVFLRGLKTYLNEFAYSNTEGSDLWNHLQQAVKETGTDLPATVHDIMNRWVLQMGFPVVSIDTATGTVSQQHFLLDPDSVVERPSEFKYQWIVPIKWMKSGGNDELYWLMQTNAGHSAMQTTGDQWLLANINVTGYYRVNYDTANWDKLLNQLRTDHQVIPVINRAQLVDDAFNLARAKIIPMSAALNTTRYLITEREYMPWQTALNNLDYLYLMFGGTEVYDLLQGYLKKQVEPLYTYFKDLTIDWSDIPEGHTEQYNQVNAVRVACSTGVDGCQNLTLTWYSQWMAQPQNNTIHPNLRATVYCSAIASGGEDQWNFGWKMFQNASIAIEANKLMAALACTKDATLLNQYLNYTLDSSMIRKQDATTVIVAVAGSVHGQTLAWNFVRDNWRQITEYGSGSFSFASLISGVTASFSTQAELDELEKFVTDNSDIGFGSANTALEQALEKTRANIRWVADYQDEIRDWFIQHA